MQKFFYLNMAFTHNLLFWFNKNKRSLPWRHNQTPYNVWLSEVILQQTRVDQGLPYYFRFIERFPDVNKLAAASEDEILKLWQGLGYYSRARNLLKGAIYIVNQLDGKFPDNAELLRKVPGIGPYTAAAVASICFNEKIPVIDGNVYRVAARLFEIKTPVNSTTAYKTFYNTLLPLVPEKAPGNFNEAMMELGALICTPVAPNCQLCPVRLHCMAYHNQTISEYPVKAARKKPKIIYLNYFVLLQNGFTLIQKRNDKGIWKNLWEFPLLESPEEIDENEVVAYFHRFTNSVSIKLKDKVQLKHQLTHQTIYATFRMAEVDDLTLKGSGMKKIAIEKMNINFAVSRLIEKFLERIS